MDNFTMVKDDKLNNFQLSDKVIHICSSVALLHCLTGLQNLPHFLNQ